MNFEENIILETSRVRLEPLKNIHLKELTPIVIKHPKLLQFSPSQFSTPEALEAYIKNALGERENKKRYPFVIYDKQLNRFVGSSSFGNISLKDLRLEIGWTWIDKSSQGTGLNKHCKFLLLEYAFEVLNMKRVELKTDSRNLQSRRAIEKIGGKFEGELRSHTLMLDGHRRNTVYYGILIEEWPFVKASFNLKPSK